MIMTTLTNTPDWAKELIAQAIDRGVSPKFIAKYVTTYGYSDDLAIVLTEGTEDEPIDL
jgi:NADPH-dependent 7-cyano-7-deazaguanine reductase QueF